MTDDPPRDFRRPKVPPSHVRAQTGHAVPVKLCDETTGKHSSEDELHAWREKRPYGERIAGLEAKLDALAQSHSETAAHVKVIASAVAGTGAQLDYLVKSAEAGERERDNKRKHTIALITALGVAVAGIVTAAVASGAVR